MRLRTFVMATLVVAAGSTLAVQAQGTVQGGRGRTIVPPIRLVPMEARVVKGVPYSADIEAESVQTLADGNRIVQRSTGRVYRDAEGRVRREDDRETGGPAVSITDPVANESYTLDTANRTAVVSPGVRVAAGSFGSVSRSGVVSGRGTGAQAGGVTGGVVGGVSGGVISGGGGFGRGTGGTVASAGGRTGGTMVSAGRGQVGGVMAGGRGMSGVSGERSVEQLPVRTIEGVQATGVKRTTTIAEGAMGNEKPIVIVSEEWTAVDLQVLVLTDVNDPRTGRSTYKLTNIRQGDPDPALFRVPDGYDVRKVGSGRVR